MIHDYEAIYPITADAIPVDQRVEIDNDEIIATLNGLIETCKDGQKGFMDAAEGIENSNLKTLLYEFSQQRSQFTGELQTLVQTLGGEPENTGSLSGSIHRGWSNLKAAVTGKDERSILSECERGEDAAKKAYLDALKIKLPEYIRDSVQTQYSAILTVHNRVKALRDEAGDPSARSATARK